ncbi:MAG: aminoacyl-tRNA hydrolase [Chloroflexi bacterium]|nr:aminoacyl-tRNA hydrolase [Chloroflexota bacterium]
MTGKFPRELTRHLIVGLGNPGPKYADNRHNIGFQCVDYIAERWNAAWRGRRFQALLAETEIDGHRVVLAKPQTFMNDSGQAVAPLSRWFKIPAERILVIYDDLDLPLARLRLRPGGSSGGHRGVQSIIEALGTQNFPRLRVGIGRPAYGDPIDYVLNDFDREQEPIVRQVYPYVEEIVRCYLNQGIHEAMNQYNGRDLIAAAEE